MQLYVKKSDLPAAVASGNARKKNLENSEKEVRNVGKKPLQKR